MNATPPAPFTLEEIARRKEESLRQIRDRKEKITTLAKEIFSPAASHNDGKSSIMRTLNTGMAVFDGVMLGMKVIRRVRSLFSGR